MERVKDKNTIPERDAGVEQLTADLLREHEMYLRALADFDNFRRRTERDRSKAAATAKREVLLPLLDIVDGFDQALAYLSDAPPNIAEGVRAIHRKLLDLLDAQGVAPIEAVGQVFDPALHEAIGTVESDGRAPGTVVAEVQHGYRLGDDVLRPARVRVAR